MPAVCTLHAQFPFLQGCNSMLQVLGLASRPSTVFDKDRCVFPTSLWFCFSWLSSVDHFTNRPLPKFGWSAEALVAGSAAGGCEHFTTARREAGRKNAHFVGKSSLNTTLRDLLSAGLHVSGALSPTCLTAFAVHLGPKEARQSLLMLQVCVAARVALLQHEYLC